VITLVLGGARSGKSQVAERLAAARGAPVTFLATYIDRGEDAEMTARIAEHRARRPVDWATVEAGPELPGVIGVTADTLVIDTLATWVAGAPGFAVDASALCDALTARAGDTIVVSDEVGLGVHPMSEAGRRFRDALGSVNAAVAAVADRVLLVVAGRTLDLERADAR
jgi:adenosyl cobinamide kinase/adenosyl cobinamide phosphate guanylyltransferase